VAALTQTPEHRVLSEFFRGAGGGYCRALMRTRMCWLVGQKAQKGGEAHKVKGAKKAQNSTEQIHRTAHSK
jgi:hypothetical protein